MTLQFDSHKERKAFKKFFGKLHRTDLNQQQALNFMKNHTEYKTDSSIKKFLKKYKNTDKLPIKFTAGKFIRTDRSRMRMKSNA